MKKEEEESQIKQEPVEQSLDEINLAAMIRDETVKIRILYFIFLHFCDQLGEDQRWELAASFVFLDLFTFLYFCVFCDQLGEA